MEAKSKSRRRLRKALALVFGEKKQGQKTWKNEHWVILADGEKKKKHWLLLVSFSEKVRSESSSHRILCNHTVSYLSKLISPLYIFGRGRPLPVFSLGLRDFLSVGSSTNKLYNDKWWPQHCESMPLRDLRLSCN